MADVKKDEVRLEGGSYEILRKRLQDQGGRLQETLNALNKDRQETFGSIQPKLLATQRITTESNCTPSDIVSVGDQFIFAYNVTFGLKSTTDLSDVFSLYRLENHEFVEAGLELIDDAEFRTDFDNLYKYYKNTVFARFWINAPHLFMVFRIGKSTTDIKTFKWLMKPDGSLQYLDNRSDHEYKFPHQQEFEWVRTNRDYFREGAHGHVSINDRIFVECIGGDLTIKVEDNTATGEGIYAEEVEHKEQKLDDADIQFAEVGPLILLRIKPYREDHYRHFVYNEKIQRVVRIDSIGDSCILLPDDHGLIFPNGYYLVSGEHKKFEYDADSMMFERRIMSPNGEDSMYVFHHKDSGRFVLLSYNVIGRGIQTPIQCHGHCFFRQGELLYFRAEETPQKHHTVQIWQTPYVSPDYNPPIVEGSFLAKIGNKELVRAMAECQNIVNLISREETYQNLYDDIYKNAVTLLDNYFWLDKEEAHNVAAVLGDVRESASAAIDEFDKVREIRKTTADRVAAAEKETKKLIGTYKADLMTRTDEFIGALADFRRMRGQIIGLRELRYVAISQIEELEKKVGERITDLSTRCVEFLLRPEALDPYHQMVSKVVKHTKDLSKAVEAKAIEDEIARISMEVETMIDVVGNLRIDDATKSTQIIDGCSEILTSLNAARADVRNKKKSLQSKEAVGEFTAQIKLIEQSVVSQLDISDTPEKCDEYQNRLMVQVEELEGRFADFDDYVIQLSDKRAEIVAAFEAKKLALVEEKNRRIDGLAKSAERILKAISGRIDTMKEVGAINAYFAGDLMVDKIRDIINKLMDLGDTVKSDEIGSKLKSTQENAIRQLRDRQELFSGGDNLITFGKHQFTVNRQRAELSFLVRGEKLSIHITGTNFFEPVTDSILLESQHYWTQDYISESREVYRGEFLAYSIMMLAGMEGIPSIKELELATEESLLAIVQKYMGPRFEEGYQKGVHDHDAARLLQILVRLHGEADLLRFEPQTRSLGRLYWFACIDKDERDDLISLITGMGRALKDFGDQSNFAIARSRLAKGLRAFNETDCLYDDLRVEDAAAYLFEEIALRQHFIISAEAGQLHDLFLRYLKDTHQLDKFDKTVEKLKGDVSGCMQLMRGWITGFLSARDAGNLPRFIDEVAALLVTNSFDRGNVHSANVITKITELKGSHGRLHEGEVVVDFPEFMGRLSQYRRVHVPAYRRYQAQKKIVAQAYRDDLRLSEFEPKVLTSFVRNRLINEVYLPMIGDNLAKQMGAAGDNKRTDLNGMLLLISPPGYGKTTLMEYIASRLGVIFVKINGPTLGHNVVSLDPEEAPNAAAREEVEKLNLALEMGDNIMIYLDDIQHCNAEFLQKFISLCDGQRRIEGVWRGRSRTYDLRGRKVAVVMAGNPYTESGDKFRIPDMLANRADTYNLGDILGDYRDAFEVSYIENALTSNRILAPLSGKPQKDIYTLIRLARLGPETNASFESSFSASEVNDYVNVLQKLFRIQDVILKVNEQYIRSAAQEDAYRTEPPFKLQGSYRNMARLAEKVVPIMNDQELTTLIVGHYEGEAQTLTTGAEANLLKFKELIGLQTPDEAQRWREIKATYQQKQSMMGMDESDMMGRAIVQLSSLTQGVGSITDKLGALDNLAEQLSSLAPRASESLANVVEQLKSVYTPREESKDSNGSQKLEFPPDLVDSIKSIASQIQGLKDQQPKEQPVAAAPQPLTVSDDSITKLQEALQAIRLRAEFPELESLLHSQQTGEPRENRGEFIAVGSMRQCFIDNGYTVEELGKSEFQIQRDQHLSMNLRVRNDRLELRMILPMDPSVLNFPAMVQKLLRLNVEIQPVSFALEEVNKGEKRIVLMETRDGKNLTRSELIEVLGSMESAAKRAKELS